MKLHEIKDMEDDEPMLITLLRQRLTKRERVAIYYRSGDVIRPMWIKRIESRESPQGPGIAGLKEWAFQCNKGNNIEWRTYDDEDFDDKFELVHGKTKGTWQFKYRDIPRRLKEGVGADLMAYSDWADVAYAKKPGLRSKYDLLVGQLLQRGYSFSISPKGTAARFKKIINPGTPAEEGIQVSIINSLATTPKNIRRTVTVSFSGADPGTGEPHSRHQSYEIEDLVDGGADLDHVLAGNLD